MPVQLRDFLFTNLARSTLVNDISASDTELTVVVEDGSDFPSADASFFIDDIFSIVLHGGNSTFEVCYCTAIAGNVLTVERGVEGTTPLAFSAGTFVVHTVTKGFLEQIICKRTTAAPSAPVVTIEELYGDGILDWTASTPAVDDIIREYRVYRQDNGVGAFVLIATVDGNILTYTDDTVDLDLNSYKWRVVGVGFCGGPGANSNEVEGGNTSFLPVMNDVNACDATADGGATAVNVNTIAGADIEVTCGTTTNKGFQPLPPIYPMPTGKYYFETKYTQLPDRVNNGIGIKVMFGRSDYFIASTDIPSPDETITWYDDYDGTTGGYLNNGAGTITVAAAKLDLNDVVGVAIDYDNQKIWYSKNNVWQGPGTQDPATNQGGFWPTNLTSVGVAGATPRPWFGPKFGLDFNTTAAKLEGRFSETYWAYTPPTGFVEIDYYVPEPGMPVSGAAIGNPMLTYNVHNFSPGLAMVAMIGGSSANDCVKHDTPRSSGKWYAEVSVFGTSVFSGSLGLRQASEANYTEEPGVAIGNDVGVAEGGLVSPNAAPYGLTNWAGSGVDGRASAATGYGDTFMMAADLDNGRVYFGLNGVWFNSQDPTNPAHGAAIPGFPTSYEFLMNSDTRNHLINTGGLQFIHTIPTGYLPWGHS